MSEENVEDHRDLFSRLSSDLSKRSSRSMGLRETSTSSTNFGQRGKKKLRGVQLNLLDRLSRPLTKFVVLLPSKEDIVLFDVEQEEEVCAGRCSSPSSVSSVEPRSAENDRIPLSLSTLSEGRRTARLFLPRQLSLRVSSMDDMARAAPRADKHLSPTHAAREGDVRPSARQGNEERRMWTRRSLHELRRSHAPFRTHTLHVKRDGPMERASSIDSSPA